MIILLYLFSFHSCENSTGPLARPRSVRFSTFAFSSVDMPHDFCPESVHNVEHAIGGIPYAAYGCLHSLMICCSPCGYYDVSFRLVFLLLYTVILTITQVLKAAWKASSSLRNYLEYGNTVSGLDAFLRLLF